MLSNIKCQVITLIAALALATTSNGCLQIHASSNSGFTTQTYITAIDNGITTCDGSGGASGDISCISGISLHFDVNHVEGPLSVVYRGQGISVPVREWNEMNCCGGTISCENCLLATYQLDTNYETRTNSVHVLFYDVAGFV